ncbi:MAG: hypothetical protein HND48_18040 [Chloroflexi bacterium]|nr:hypothetical protein [Chloroflexota bacterium]
MSIYATLAASALFGHADRVWVVLSPDHVIAPGKFHIKSRELPARPVGRSAAGRRALRAGHGPGKR